MTLFKGGISKVEIDDNVGFATPTEIPGIMKTSKVEFSTPTEDDALNKAVGGGKAVKMNLETEDMTQNTWLAEVIAAEAAHGEIYAKITGVNTAQTLILKKVKVITDLKPEEAGKNWKRVVSGTGFADSEANLMALTLA
jgi:hypothetical protein